MNRSISGSVPAFYPHRYKYSIRGVNIMNNEYTAMIKNVNEWWIGWIEEVPAINCQEHTREDLIESLRITLKEALKDLYI